MIVAGGGVLAGEGVGLQFFTTQWKAKSKKNADPPVAIIIDCFFSEFTIPSFTILFPTQGRVEFFSMKIYKKLHEFVEQIIEFSKTV